MRRAATLEDRLQTRSPRAWLRHFESHAFPDALPEIGSRPPCSTPDRKPHLVEVNAKPGIAGIGSETKPASTGRLKIRRCITEMWTVPAREASRRLPASTEIEAALTGHATLCRGRNDATCASALASIHR